MRNQRQVLVNVEVVVSGVDRHGRMVHDPKARKDG